MDKQMNVTVALRGIDNLNPKVKEGITRITDLTARVKQTRDRLKEVSITQNQIKGFSNLKAETVKVKKELDEARNKATALGKALAIGEATAKDLDKARRAVRALDGQYNDLLEKTNKSRKALENKGVTTAKLAAQTRDLRLEEEKLLRVQERQEKAQRSAGAMRARAGTLATTGASMMLPGYAITRGLGGALGEFADYRAGLRQIAITADMTDEQMKSFGDHLIRTSGEVFQSTIKLKEGAEFLIAAGMSEDVAQRAIQPIGKVATAYQAEMLDMARSTDVLIQTLGILPENLMGSFGLMATAGKRGSFELRDMAKSLPVLGSGFAALKMTGNEALATMAAGLQLAKKGAPSADIAANNMQNFLAKVMSPETLKKAQEKFGLDLYGVISKAQASGANPFDAAINSIFKATKGGDQKLLGDLFQDMQVQSFLRPLFQDMERYRSIKTEALAAIGSSVVDTDFAKAAKELNAQIDRAGSSWENLKLKLGESLEPVMNPTYEAFSKATTSIVEFAQEHPKLITLLATLAGIMGVLLVVGGGLSLMAAAILVPWAAFTLISGALGVSLLPVLLVLGAIALAIAAVVAAFVYWDEIVGWFKGKWEELKAELSVIGEFFMTVGLAILDGLIKPILNGGAEVVRAIVGLVSRGVDAVKAFLGIRSPSRVFAGIGLNTAQGLALGVERGTPSAVASVRRMAAGVAVAGVATVGAVGAAAAGGPGGAAGAGAAGGGVQIGPVSIVINGAGMDAEAIGREVERRLQALARQARTDAQARFFDDN